MLRGVFLELLERPRARSVEHINSAQKLTTVVVIAIRFRVMT